METPQSKQRDGLVYPGQLREKKARGKGGKSPLQRKARSKVRGWGWEKSRGKKPEAIRGGGGGRNAFSIGKFIGGGASLLSTKKRFCERGGGMGGKQKLHLSTTTTKRRDFPQNHQKDPTTVRKG